MWKTESRQLGGYMNKLKQKLLCMDVLLLAILVIIDQITKNLAVTRLKNRPPFVIIDGVLELSYLENRGAAFGILQERKLFFVVIACIFLAAICYVLLKAPGDRKYLPLHLLLTVIAAGAAGNMADRLRLDYVVDFIYFSLINFPIFNVADIYVTTATALLAIQILFLYKEEDFGFLGFGRKDTDNKSGD